MRTSYQVTYFIPIPEIPEAYRKLTIEVTRPYPLTKDGVQRVLQDQLQSPELIVADFKQVKTNPLQFDLFLPCEQFQVNPEGTKAVEIQQSKSGKFVGVLHTGENITEGSKEALGKPVEVKKSVRLSTVVKWTKERLHAAAQQLNIAGI